MTTYAIGDVQGCFSAFQSLLEKIQFDPIKDDLWLTGDLVNRGPQSLEVLRFVKSLRAKTVLGNHDLHLLAVFYGAHVLREKDTFRDILQAPDCDELMHWLRHQPLFFYDDESGYAILHAGIASSWTIQKAKMLSQEVEAVLQGEAPHLFFQNMYGDMPCKWEDRLSGMERLRCITNYFTRMRFCHADGSLDLSYKGTLQDAPKELIHWFDVKTRVNAQNKIIFGHWAALSGKTDVPFVYPLDTGCVWGHCLTAMRLSDEKRFEVSCG